MICLYHQDVLMAKKEGGHTVQEKTPDTQL